MFGWTAKACTSKATALAQTLMERMPAGSVVSFMLPNWHEAAVIYLGATLAGMVVNPILPSLRDRELAFILSDADSRAIFVPSTFGNHDYAAMLDRVTAPNERRRRRSWSSAATTRAPHRLTRTLFAGADAAVLPVLNPDTVRMILYTSGTTGRPKGVLHTHNSIHALIRQIGEHWLVSDGDTFLVPSPIAHIGGSIYAFECPLLLGTTAVLMERWDPDRAVSLMQAERCTHMAGATPFLDGLLGAAERAGTRLPDLKVFICGGASVPPSLIRRAAELFREGRGVAGVRVDRGAGHDRGFPGRHRPCGRHRRTAPGIADIKLVEGEICARGPQMLVGYLHPEDETASFDDEGSSAPVISPAGSTTGTGGHRPSQGHHHPQRREHLAQGSGRRPHRPSGDRRDRGGRRARRADRRTGVRRHRGRRPTRHPAWMTCVSC